jgi:hypothetical protein
MTECMWNIGKIILTGRNRNSVNKPALALLRQPQIPREMSCDRT